MRGPYSAIGTNATADGLARNSHLGAPGSIAANRSIQTPNTKGVRQKPIRKRDVRGTNRILGIWRVRIPRARDNSNSWVRYRNTHALWERFISGPKNRHSGRALCGNLRPGTFRVHYIHSPSRFSKPVTVSPEPQSLPVEADSETKRARISPTILWLAFPSPYGLVALATR